MTEPRPTTTTDAESPRPVTTTLFPLGQTDHLLQDHYLIQKMAQFNRERVPERVVHAKAGGAFGVMEITEDVSQFTKAKLFQKGAQPRALYENVLSDTDRANLAGNIVAHASKPEVTAQMKARVVEYWRNVSKDLSDNVAKGLGANGG